MHGVNGVFLVCDGCVKVWILFILRVPGITRRGAERTEEVGVPIHWMGRES